MNIATKIVITSLILLNIGCTTKQVRPESEYLITGAIKSVINNEGILYYIKYEGSSSVIEAYDLANEKRKTYKGGVIWQGGYSPQCFDIKGEYLYVLSGAIGIIDIYHLNGEYKESIESPYRHDVLLALEDGKILTCSLMYSKGSGNGEPDASIIDKSGVSAKNNHDVDQHFHSSYLSLQSISQEGEQLYFWISYLQGPLVYSKDLRTQHFVEYRVLDIDGTMIPQAELREYYIKFVSTDQSDQAQLAIVKARKDWYIAEVNVDSKSFKLKQRLDDNYFGIRKAIVTALYKGKMRTFCSDGSGIFIIS